MSADVSTDETVTDESLRNSEAYAEGFHGARPIAPAKHMAVVACMDARLDIFKILGLTVGDAHVIRNAGGVVTDDAMRSLVISQRLLGTREIVLIHHTECGMTTFEDDAFGAALEAETGVRPAYAFHTFADLDDDVRAGIARIKADPHLVERDRVRGFVFDVATGRLREVV
jgi:carbonic anhydrase